MVVHVCPALYRFREGPQKRADTSCLDRALYLQPKDSSMCQANHSMRKASHSPVYYTTSLICCQARILNQSEPKAPFQWVFKNLERDTTFCRKLESGIAPCRARIYAHIVAAHGGATRGSWRAHGRGRQEHTQGRSWMPRPRAHSHRTHDRPARRTVTPTPGTGHHRQRAIHAWGWQYLARSYCAPRLETDILSLN